MAAKYWFVTGNGSAAWNTAANWYNGPGGTGGTAGGAPVAGDDAIVNAASGSGTLSTVSSAACSTLDLTGFTGTLNLAFNITIGTTTPTLPYVLRLGGTIAGASNFSFAGAGGQIITNGIIISGGATFNSTTGGSWTLADAFTCIGTLTLTQGTLSTSNIITVGNISSSNTNTRSFTGTDIYITGTGGASMTIQTGLSFSCNNIHFVSNISSKTITLSGVFSATNLYLDGSSNGAITAAAPTGVIPIPNIFITNTGGTTIDINTSTFRNFEFVTGCNVNFIGNSVVTIIGNLKLTSTISIIGTATFTLTGADTGNVTITSAGKTFLGQFNINDGGANTATYNFIDDFNNTYTGTNGLAIISGGNITFNGIVNTFVAISITGGNNITFKGNVTCGANFTLNNVNTNIILGTNNLVFNITGLFNLNAGSFNTTSPKDYNLTCNSLAGSNSSVRALNMGSGIWTITGSGTSWTFSTSTNLTFTGNNAKLIFTCVGGSTQTCNFGGQSYGNVIFNSQSLNTQTTINGSNTFKSISVLTTSAGSGGSTSHTLIFGNGSTQTVENFFATGDPTIFYGITSVTTSTHALVKSTPGIIKCDYLSIQHSIASPANTWYAGNNSANFQGIASAGSGWIFNSAPPKNLGLLGVG